MKVFQTLTITDVLAFYGAVLASIGFGWNLYRDLLDRPQLRVGANIRRIVRSPDGRFYGTRPDLPIEGASEQVFVCIDVTNVGRRQIQWQGWGAHYLIPINGKKSLTVVPINLPKMLKEGETHTEFTPELKPKDNIKQIFVWDAAGKRWYLSRRAMRKLREESRKFQT